MSKKISELPLYSGANQPVGFMPIVIGGTTYKIIPENLVIARKYDVYTALLSQIDDKDPTDIILENTIGNITLKYISVGNYKIIFDFDLDITRVWYQFGGVGDVSSISSNPGQKEIMIDGLNIFINTFDNNLHSVNNQLNKTPIEIRYYK